jgi:hypothetical protein
VKATKKAPTPNVPFLKPLFPAIKPLMYLGYSLLGASSMLALPEYLRENGTKGLVNTRSGRTAALGAISGASLLGSLWMPASPLQLYVDVAANALWLAEIANEHGWLDPLLGADPKKKAEPAPATK